MIPFIDGNSSSIPEPEVNLGNLEAKYVPPPGFLFVKKGPGLLGLKDKTEQTVNKF